MLIQNIWIGHKKYIITKIETCESPKGSRIMQKYYGYLPKYAIERLIATIEYHKPTFKEK